MKIQELIEAIGAHVKHPAVDMQVKGISTDTRTIKKGDCFFALKGPNFNGHAFVKEAYEKGACGAVVEILPGLEPKKSFNVMVVRDTLRALGFLASHVRSQHDIPLVAVAGSAGKTTTKEMIASILTQSRPVLKTEGNKNNLVGLPLTLLRLNSAHRAAVVELGISEPGEMERLARTCRPDVAVITNIGRGHLMNFGGLEAVAKAKAPVFEELSKGGTKVVNADDPWTRKIDSVMRPELNRVAFGAHEKADVRVKGYSLRDDLTAVDMTFDVRGETAAITVHSPAVANVMNAAAAIAAVLPLNATVKEIEDGLKSFAPLKHRMEAIRANGYTILDDTYNANPEAVISALSTLKSAKGRKVAVLGEMLELGEASSSAHREIGARAALAGVALLAAIGAHSKDVIEGAVSNGMKASSCLAFVDKASAIAGLKGLIKEGDVILVKASRGAGLETVVEELKKA